MHDHSSKFEDAKSLSAEEIRDRIAHRVRAERAALGLSQREFADRCGIALRTYKRFELGEGDSLTAFIRIVAAFERVIAFELLFPPKQVLTTPTKTAIALARRLATERDGIK